MGWDVVCRVGDPTNSADLLRVGATRATAIIIQMTDADADEEELHDKCLQNGVTFQTLLALRHVLFMSPKSLNWDDLRIVVQLQAPSAAVQSACFSAPNGRPVVFAQDLSMFVNSLMFSCIAHPSLANVLVDLLGFEGIAIRLRLLSTFPKGGKDIVGKTVEQMAFQWENAVLVGVLSSVAANGTLTEADENDGMAVNPKRVLTEGDRLIFVSTSSAPTAFTGAVPAAANRVPSRQGEEEQQHPLDVLVCGWRDEWNDPRRFAFRLWKICSELPPGSTITFMNMYEPQEFKDVMEEVKGAPSSLNSRNSFTANLWSSNCSQALDVADAPLGSWTCMSVGVHHQSGDASRYPDLMRVLQPKAFNVAVLLSTNAKAKLPAASRDRRLLAMCLFIRHIQSELSQPAMRIVGENALDVTSMYALAPRDDQPVEPDFVNIHAIYARALCQALAYPRMVSAIDQLLSNAPGTPSLVLQDAALFVPLKTPLSFAEVVQLVKRRSPWACCLGYRKSDGALVTIPNLSDECMYEDGDRLILITRDANMGVGVGGSKSTKECKEPGEEVGVFVPCLLAPNGAQSSDRMWKSESESESCWL